MSTSKKSLSIYFDALNLSFQKPEAQTVVLGSIRSRIFMYGIPLAVAINITFDNVTFC